MSLKIKNNDYSGLGRYDKYKGGAVPTASTPTLPAGAATEANQTVQANELALIKAELQKLTDNNTLEQVNITTAGTYTYQDFASITFTVYGGKADVTINGVTITYPLNGNNGIVAGGTWTADAEVPAQVVISPAAGGRVLVTLVK